MLLSRIFSLMLGTTLFVMIWTMQDGNHSAQRMGMAADMRPIPHTLDADTEVAAFSPVHSQVADPISSVPVVAEQALWIFAEEPAAQIAVK